MNSAPLISDGGRSLPQTVTEFKSVNNKQKQKREGTFIDFKKLETAPDNNFEIDRECFMLVFEDNEAIKCLFLFVDKYRTFELTRQESDGESTLNIQH